LLDAVEAVVNGDTVRPLTDQVTVQSAALVPFAIEANLTLYAGPDAGLIEDTARAALAAFLAANRKLGRDHPRSALIAALHVAGVQKVDLVEPAADVVVTPLQVAQPGEPAITIAGTGE
jgi:phage-related baseplate assembly protein